MTDIGPLEWIKLAIYYVSYLYVVAAPAALWMIFKYRGSARLLSAGFLIVITLIAYGRFVEPRILLTARHDITLDGCFKTAGEARIAVLSDIHQGLFKNTISVDRIARRVETENPDFVLIAGDFVYFLAPARFDDAFGAFSDIPAPVFAVLGNHDIGLPGPDVSAPLQESLPRLGVQLIDNQALRLSNSRFTLELVGLSDQWGGMQKLSLLETQTQAPRLVLTHNPATIYDIQKSADLDLLIGGHTHGGQVQLPLLTCIITGVCGKEARGLRKIKDVQVFTTSGAGMSGLPMRFRVPPRIDIISLRYASCVSH